MYKSGRKYPLAVGLDDNGAPIEHELYTPEDRPARPVGCTSCAAPLQLVEEGKKLGSIRTKRYFKSAGGLQDHWARGCKIDHTRVERSGKVTSLLSYVSEPAQKGQRKLLYLNMPAAKSGYGAEDALPALVRMQMTRKSDTIQGVFASAAQASDGPSWRVKTGAELAHVAFHPLAHTGLIDEVDVISEFHRFPLRRMMGAVEEIAAQSQLDAARGLSYPALLRARIEPGQKQAGHFLSWVYGAGAQLYQLDVTAEGAEKDKIEKTLDRGGAFSLYGHFTALDAAAGTRAADRLRNHDVFIPLEDLQLLRLRIARAGDIMRYKPGSSAGLDY